MFPQSFPGKEREVCNVESFKSVVYASWLKNKWQSNQGFIISLWYLIFVFEPTKLMNTKYCNPLFHLVFNLHLSSVKYPINIMVQCWVKIIHQYVSFWAIPFITRWHVLIGSFIIILHLACQIFMKTKISNMYIRYTTPVPTDLNTYTVCYDRACHSNGQFDCIRTETFWIWNKKLQSM